MGYYIKYVLENTEPLRITDEESSDGHQIETLYYISGASLRGYIIGRLSRMPNFEEKKKNLLMNVKFKNAYLSYKKDGEFRELIPSLKGFYESKKRVKEGERKEIQTILDGKNHNPSYKRARCGNFSLIDENEIKYLSVDTDSALRIKTSHRNGDGNAMFRSSFITKGQIFKGSIWTEDREMAEEIAEQIGNEIVIGHGRYLGYGKCRVWDLKIVSDKERKNIPYENYIPETDQKEDIYMILLSHSVMKDDMGEVCGINIEELEKVLGVSEMEIRYCSTATTKISGYNRTWKAAVPSIRMYEAGSVFHLFYKGIMSAENIRKISVEGIGERKNEGCGEVRFLTKLPESKRPIVLEETIGKIIPDVKDRETLRTVAKAYFVKEIRNSFPVYNVKHSIKKAGVSRSQLGDVLAILMAEKCDPEKAFESAEAFLDNAVDKGEKSRTHKKKGCFNVLQDNITRVRKQSTREFYEYVAENCRNKIFGFDVTDILTEKELLALKVNFLISYITFGFRGEEE